MKKFIERHELLFTLLSIVAYVFINSYCLQNFGVANNRTVFVNFLMLFILLFVILSSGKGKYYGITKFPRICGFFLYIPLILIVSVNFWGGINIDSSFSEMKYFMLSMVSAAFIEELIFRGFLFKMMEKDNKSIAILVSSLTFGIGHIINIFNGAEIISTLFQICYAVAVGYLFVIIFDKGKSLWPCIITHCALNALSIFSVKSTLSTYVIPIFLVVISLWYSKYIKENVV